MRRHLLDPLRHLRQRLRRLRQQRCFPDGRRAQLPVLLVTPSEHVKAPSRADLHRGTLRARRLLGGNGILIDVRSMQHTADRGPVSPYEGTHHVHGPILGRDVTGIAAY